MYSPRPAPKPAGLLDALAEEAARRGGRERKVRRPRRRTGCPARRMADLVRTAEDAEGLLYDAVLALKDFWRPSYGEAVVAALAEAGLSRSLAAVRATADAELFRLARGPRVA